MRPHEPSGFSNYKRIRKMLVGAVGVESNEKLYLKDLPGMHW